MSQHNLIVFFSLFFFCERGYTQQLASLEVSKEKRQAYQAILNKNKDVVTFIENCLVQNRLPKMLRNLALIESSFNKNVVSSANAGGVWQFMETHAANYGLKSKDRFDVYHSTQVAMLSLKDLYKKYGNWITVVAAYNCGEGNVAKAMSEANSNRYDKFYVYLPSETIQHVHKFMEACLVTNELGFLMADYKLSRFEPTPKTTAKADGYKNPALVSTEINATYNLNIIAEEMEIKLADLVSWNPKISQELTKDGVAMLYLPIDRMPDFLLLKNTILNRSIQLTYHDK